MALSGESFLILLIGLFTCFIGLLFWRKRDIFEPIFGYMILYFMFFVVRPIYILSGQNPFDLAKESIIKMSLVGTVGMIGFYFGYFTKFYSVLISSIHIRYKNMKNNNILIFAALYICLSLMALFLIFRNLGFQNVVNSSITVIFHLKKGGGIIGYSLGLAGIVFLLLASTKFYCPHLPFIYSSLLLFSFLLSIIISLFIGLRGVFAQNILSFIILWIYSKKKRGPKFNSGIGILILFLGIVFMWGIIVPLNLFRHYGRVGWVSAFSPSFIVGQIQGVLYPFDWLTFLSTRTEPLFFAPYINLLFILIPRAIWPAKPIISIEYLLSEKFLGDPSYFPTMTMTIPGELYLNLSWIGPIIGMFIVAVFLRMIYEYRDKNPDLWIANFIFVIFYVYSLRAFYTSFQTWLIGIIMQFINISPFLIFGINFSVDRKR